jgi:hypothetical protein
VKLEDLHFRTNERFLYEYDFGDLWQNGVALSLKPNAELGIMFQ